MAKKLKSNCKFCGKEFTYDSSSHGYYCNNKCQALLSSKEYLEKLKDGSFVGMNKERGTMYKHLRNERGNKCEICNITSWNDKEIRFWVDHIDGNALNNIWTNLRLICPNCDSQLDTCRAKNKGKGRKSLGLKY